MNTDKKPETLSLENTEEQKATEKLQSEPAFALLADNGSAGTISNDRTALPCARNDGGFLFFS